VEWEDNRYMRGSNFYAAQNAHGEAVNAFHQDLRDAYKQIAAEDPRR
jgi:hypothetical protein